MSNENKYTDLNLIDTESKRFFRGGTFEWERSQEDVWAEMRQKVHPVAPAKERKVNFRGALLAVAALFVLLIGVGVFMNRYTKTAGTTPGMHLTATLPDGSTVRLNAVSSVTYHPYWWRFSRKVVFNGEGFFEVQKGKKFQVISPKGITEVLGTSFNVYARDEMLRVTCVTGKVKVSSNLQDEVILTPGTKAEVTSTGKISFDKEADTTIETSWRNNVFFFTATPISEVFREVERQYGIRLTLKVNNFQLYTGNFKKEENIEDVLGLVCPPLGLDFKKQSGKEYVIFQNN